jgi:Restriction endonuclease S subunits
MEEWKEYRIGDVCKTISDTYRGNAKNVVLINTSEVLEGKCLNHIKTPNKDLKGQFKKTFRKDDILYSEIRPANRRYAYIDFDATDYIASTKLMVIRHNERILPQYLFYILKSQAVLDELQMLAESRSGTFPQITFSEVANIEIKLPPIEQQRRILGVLKSLDDKIEANRRINENLEQQAQALFKSWFVDFEPFKDGEFVESELGMIPKGWRVGTLNEIADITMGTSPSGTSYNTEGQGDVFYQGRAEFGFRFPKRNMYTTEAKRFAEVDSVLVSVRAPVGDINVAEERCCIGRGLASVRSKTNNNSYILYLMLSIKPVFDRFNGEGTVFGSINKKAFEEIQIVIPAENQASKFNTIVCSIDEQIKRTELESRRLATLRDILLPKLMSGELKVNEVEI